MSTWYRTKKKIQHRFQGKARHGVHSPFVFALSEYLRRHKKYEEPLLLLTSGNQRLINQLIGYLMPQQMIWLSDNQPIDTLLVSMKPQSAGIMALTTTPITESEFGALTPDMVIIDRQDEQAWRRLFQAIRGRMQEKGCFMILKPHVTPAHSEVWRQIHQLPEVRLSIDMLDVGLLFFDQAFLEKQHFLIRTP